MNIEDLTDNEIEAREEEIRHKIKVDNGRVQEQHYGSREDVSVEESDFSAAERANRIKVDNSRVQEQHYGSREDADDATISVMKANVAEKRKQAVPHKEYFNNLLENFEISDPEQFESAVLGSMQSNGVMRDFVEGLFEKLGEKIFRLKNIDKNDGDAVNRIQQEIEKMVAVYEKYMYTLKENEWEFNNLNEMKMPEHIKENLWQQQKRLDIEFKMPIPADMGEYYGGKFERDCKMVPAFETMYQDLVGKNVNWHGVMIYKEGELTPQQRYRQRLQEQIKQKQETLAGKEIELKTLEERQQGGQVYGE